MFGELIAPQSPDAQDLALGVTPPSGDHLLGTDELGRDVFSRVIVGARTAVIGPVLIALGGTFIGVLLGLMAGYAGGWLDTITLRWADLMFALPGHLVAIVVVGVLGGGYAMAIVVLIVLSSPYDTRLMRAATLEQRPRPYVEAARLLGLPGRRIAVQHIWPNLVPLVMASGFLGFAYGLLALSALSFLGLGVGPGTADWGRMLAESLVLIFSNPAGALAPGGMIVLTAASVNLIGDWLEEVLSDRGRAR
ncbi:MAG: ABC transporter permease [Geodermatophilaceae bacterium]|nr:ABC transporter permease [Geodermatophilaceae bacterium]